MSDRPGNNRRSFLQAVLAGPFLAKQTARSSQSGEGTPFSRSADRGKSRVVIARDPMLRGPGRTVDTNRLAKMLDSAVQSLYRCDSAREAWGRVAARGQVVGLKVNCLGGRGISTSVPLVEAICDRLQRAGLPPGNIVIWDRLNSDLESAGFKVVRQRERIRCLGNDEWGYEEDLAAFGSAASRMSTALTRVCDLVINLPVLKDHGIVGVTGALKNLFGAIHNPNKYHVNVGDPYVADVYMLPPVREKVRLTICDATTAQYEGGPPYMPQWSWPFNGLIVAHDPVAIDHTAWKIIERKRAEKGMKSLAELKRAPAYIATAADSAHRLGTNDPKRIELVEI
jgi:uncharacterized protein (DUF362 family)